MFSPSHKPQPDPDLLNEDAPEIAEERSEVDEVTQLQEQVIQAKEALLRSQADYQNLLRRTQEERSRLIKMSTQELMSDLLQPLDHLSLAAAELKDQGLDMTIKQFWQTLSGYGLQEIEVMGKPFDVNLMEVVDRKGDGEIVTKVVKRGYTLHGEVIQHAKVIVGESSDSLIKNQEIDKK